MATAPDKPNEPLLTPEMWAVLSAVVAAVGCWIGMVASPAQYDSAIFRWMGGRMTAGDLPYRDLWDNKLPLLYWINWLAAATGEARYALFAMQTLAVAAGAWMLFGLARRCWGDLPAGLASLLYAAMAADPMLLGGGNLTESWAAPCVIACIWAMFRYASGGRQWRWWPMLSGLAMGAAVSLRPPAMLAAAALLVMLPSLRRRGRLRPGAVGMWLGGLLILPAVQVAWAWANGVLGPMVESCIAFNFAYGTSAERPEWATWSGVLERYVGLLANSWAFHAMAAGGLLTLAITWPARRRGTEDFPALGRWVLLAWLAGGAVSALPSMRLYTHHYYLALAPLALATAVLWQRLMSAKPAAGRVVGWVLILALAASVGLRWDREHRQTRDEQKYARPARMAADAIARDAGPGDTLFVLPWGYETEIWGETGLPSNTRHAMAAFYPELHTRDQLLAEWRAEMLAHPPDWLVVPLRANLVGGDLTEFTFHGWNAPEMARYYEPIHARYRDLYERRDRAEHLLIYRLKQDAGEPAEW